jgi:hypothetical protein
VQPCTMWAAEKSPYSEREQVLKEQQARLTLLDRQPIARLMGQIALVTNLVRTVFVFLIVPHVFAAGRIYFSCPTQ